MKFKFVLALTCAWAQPATAYVATPPTTAQANTDKEKGLDNPAYLAALATSRGLATNALNALFANNKVDVIIAQTNGPAWLSTLGKGDAFSGPSASQLPAVAGFPHLTVPMGLSGGLPIGLSFIGPKWHDHNVLKAGFAYEQLSKARVAPQFRYSVESK